jgi:hypothetical protein
MHEEYDDYDGDTYHPKGEGMTEEQLSEAVANLVNRGILEQYIDENGEFVFGLTDFGKLVAQELKKEKDEDEE